MATTSCGLKFSTSNSKLNRLKQLLAHRENKSVTVIGFDLPAGYTCPAASVCKSYANRFTGHIIDSKNMEFRCYAASLEAAFKDTRKARWHNFDRLRGRNVDEMVDELHAMLLVSKPRVVRIHSSGDFFSDDYYKAWAIVATMFPNITFFGYTKTLVVLADRPGNLYLAYSNGGRNDSHPGVIDYACKATVVRSKDEADALGLPIACPTPTSPDDYDYIIEQKPFALLIHGTQPKNKKRGKMANRK